MCAVAALVQPHLWCINGAATSLDDICSTCSRFYFIFCCYYCIVAYFHALQVGNEINAQPTSAGLHVQQLPTGVQRVPVVYSCQCLYICVCALRTFACHNCERFIVIADDLFILWYSLRNSQILCCIRNDFIIDLYVRIPSYLFYCISFTYL